MTYQTIGVTTRGAIAEIRLNRPTLANALDQQALAEIDHAAAAISDDLSVMVVLLTAAGAVFSRGWAEDAEIPLFAPAYLPFRSLELIAQPVIACIEGDALGAGLELALACDVRIASDAAAFAMTQVAAGAVPSLGGTQRLPRLVGRGRATAMILLGEQLDAKAAHACGLVNEIAAAGQVRGRADDLASSIAAQGPIAVRYAKEAIRQGLDMPLEQALRYETDLTVILQTTDDRAEGVRAFLEKRKPKFDGT